MESVSLAFTPAGGVPALLAFENFVPTESDSIVLGIVYPFEDGQGGFGATDPEQVRFLE